MKRFFKICGILILFLYIVKVFYEIVYMIIDNVQNNRKPFDFTGADWQGIFLPNKIFTTQGNKTWPGKLLAVFVFAYLIIKRKIKFS